MDLSIRNCKFAYRCNQRWENLTITEDNNIRFCHDCEKEVHRCLTDDELVRSVRLNRCIAITVTAHQGVKLDQPVEMVGDLTIDPPDLANDVLRD